MTQDQLAAKLVAYMLSKGYSVDSGAGEINIVYLEGSNEDGTRNADLIDLWNDRSIVFDFAGSTPRILMNAEATTEPGLSATMSKAARTRGGVARIKIGQWKAWSVGNHKSKAHPALVQVRPVTVCRDYNRDGKRTHDQEETGLFGINQHGTRPGVKPTKVGTWSEGCLVRRFWADHEAFVAICRSDVRYRLNPGYVFTSTVIDGDDFEQF